VEKGGCGKGGTIPYFSIGSIDLTLGPETLGPETLSILGRVACRQLFFGWPLILFMAQPVVGSKIT
jgi:hypothetical protein